MKIKRLLSVFHIHSTEVPTPFKWQVGRHAAGILLLAQAYLLLSLQEAFQVICVQVILVVAVGEHQQVQIAPCRHHLVEGTELLKVQRALVVICVSLLQHTAMRQSGTQLPAPVLNKQTSA